MHPSGPSNDQLPVQWAELFNTTPPSSNNNNKALSTILSNTRSLGTTIHQHTPPKTRVPYEDDLNSETSSTNLGYKDSGFNSGNSSRRQSMSPLDGHTTNPSSSQAATLSDTNGKNCIFFFALGPFLISFICSININVI